MVDIPLVDRALAHVRDDADEVLVNTSHRSALLTAHVGRGATIVDEGARPLGTAATLRALGKRLTGTLLTWNCDLVTDLAAKDLIEHHRRAGLTATLAVAPAEERADLIDTDNGLRLIDRRTANRPGYRFLGAACFEERALEAIEDRVPLGLTEGLLRPLVEAGEVSLFHHRGLGMDAGTLAGLLEASQAVLGGSGGPGTTVARSPLACYVGPGADVSPENLVSGSIVSAGAVVASSARLSNVLVMPGGRVGAGALHRAIVHGTEILHL